MAEQILLKANDGTHDVYPQWHGTVDGAGNVQIQNPGCIAGDSGTVKLIDTLAITSGAAGVAVLNTGPQTRLLGVAILSSGAANLTVTPSILMDGKEFVCYSADKSAMTLVSAMAFGAGALKWIPGSDYLRADQIKLTVSTDANTNLSLYAIVGR